ncbi:hypothetical protein AQ731_29010 [Burkholderia pseudomallei]|nr:hypothetical protein AQ731_29010 [Burkholderia pseudomallei]
MLFFFGDYAQGVFQRADTHTDSRFGDHVGDFLEGISLLLCCENVCLDGFHHITRTQAMFVVGFFWQCRQVLCGRIPLRPSKAL